MTTHFTEQEFETRKARTCDALSKSGLDGLLIFAPESQYWLCGYDTFGYAMFQCMVLTARGDLHLLTRAPDRLQALETSTLAASHVHVWSEHQSADPLHDLKALLSELDVMGGALGYESRTAGLTDYYGRALRAELPALIDTSELIASLRRRKSPAEIAMLRKAANLSDDALDAALDHTHAGAFEGDILAAMQGAVFQGGGDYAGNEFILGSDRKALLCRSQSGRRHLSQTDQLTLEWAGAYARYHAAMMRTVVIGQPIAVQEKMFDAASEALESCEAAIRPGAPMGDVYEAHASVFDTHGFGHARLQACGYAMGIAYPPIWVEFPMFYEGNPMLVQRDQVFFLHMILMDGDSGLAMTLGHSVLVTDAGIERLSRHAPAMLSL